MTRDAESNFERLCREADERQTRENGRKNNGVSPFADVGLEDFVAYMPLHNYIFTPTRDLWPASSVNARIFRVQVGTNEKGEPIEISASAWLDQNKPVEQMTWAPGEPHADQRPTDFRRRLDRATGMYGLQSLSRTDVGAVQWRRRNPLARSYPSHLSDRGRSHHSMARPSCAATRRED